jgi:hypothetical protein
MLPRAPELRDSAVGMSGLELWLTKAGGSVQGFSGGWEVDPSSVGLLVLPMQDTAPDIASDPARSKKEVLFQQDETDLRWLPIYDKADQATTLIVLPKWRSGVRLTGVAHPALWVDAARIDAILLRLTGVSSITLNRTPQAFTTLPYQDTKGAKLAAEIYAAQLFDGTECDPIIGSGPQTLLAACPLRSSDVSVLILSDPDLLNNHGLRLGQNAAIARDFLISQAKEGRILIDYSPDNWFTKTDAPVTRDRSWADLLRFFEPPFQALWVGAGITLVLVLWRSLRRAAPVAVGAGKDTGKMQAIRARARLMRLSGQDGALIGDYASARIAATAARLVGPVEARQISEEQAFLRFLARRRPDLSADLEAALTRLRALAPHIPAATALDHVEALEQILEAVVHDT